MLPVLPLLRIYSLCSRKGNISECWVTNTKGVGLGPAERKPVVFHLLGSFFTMLLMQWTLFKGKKMLCTKDGESRSLVTWHKTNTPDCLKTALSFVIDVVGYAIEILMHTHTHVHISPRNQVTQQVEVLALNPDDLSLTPHSRKKEPTPQSLVHQNCTKWHTCMHTHRNECI